MLITEYVHTENNFVGRNIFVLCRHFVFYMYYSTRLTSQDASEKCAHTHIFIHLCTHKQMHAHTDTPTHMNVHTPVHRNTHMITCDT
jgi:hypothetical protein